MSGFITIERGLFAHEFFDNEPMSEREAWVWLIANARWKDGRHKVGKDMYDVPRGSFMATLREMQSRFMWRSDTRVRNFLKRLEKEGMIERTTVGSRNAPKTHVTICNYSSYQTSERTENAPKTHHERTKNAVKKQGNKGTREQEKDSLSPLAPKSASGSRLSQDWFLPKSWGDYGIENGATPDLIRTESENFKDYWIGLAGAKARKADWQATWRGWIRRAIANTPKQKHQLKTINGGRNDQALNNSTDQRSDPALEQALRLAGVSQAQGNAFDGA